MIQNSSNQRQRLFPLNGEARCLISYIVYLKVARQRETLNSLEHRTVSSRFSVEKKAWSVVLIVQPDHSDHSYQPSLYIWKSGRHPLVLCKRFHVVGD